MTEDYHDSAATTYIDGTSIFKSDKDEKAEAAIARRVAPIWGVKLHSFGKLAPIDWWAERTGRFVGVCEFKRRYNPMRQYPTVFINVRKWLSLMLAETGLGVPALYLVEWDDATRWIDVKHIDPARNRIGGTQRAKDGINDIEPIIEIDIDTMKELTSGD